VRPATNRLGTTAGVAAVCVKYWEIIADNFSKAGWSWGCVGTVDRERRPIFVTDASRGDEKCFVVRADEKLTAFLQLERQLGNQHIAG
jgi:hypothetical protein